MTRRPLSSSSGAARRAHQRMAPGGRLWSESPVRGPAVRVVATGADPEPTAFPASTWGYNSAEPPYDSWVTEWDINLPTDLLAPGYITATIGAAGDTRTSFQATTYGLDYNANAIVTFSGGPFTPGQVVTSSSIDVDMRGGDSADLVIGYTKGPSDLAPGFEITDVVLWVVV